MIRAKRQNKEKGVLNSVNNGEHCSVTLLLELGDKGMEYHNRVTTGLSKRSPE
jgi:hypothetical protein